jgi:hypothetical protein
MCLLVFDTELWWMNQEWLEVRWRCECNTLEYSGTFHSLHTVSSSSSSSSSSLHALGESPVPASSLIFEHVLENLLCDSLGVDYPAFCSALTMRDSIPRLDNSFSQQGHKVVPALTSSRFRSICGNQNERSTTFQTEKQQTATCQFF